jgi:hypothetical protein
VVLVCDNAAKAIADEATREYIFFIGREFFSISNLKQ